MKQQIAIYLRLSLEDVDKRTKQSQGREQQYRIAAYAHQSSSGSESASLRSASYRVLR